MRTAALALVLLLALPATPQPIFPEFTGAELRAALMTEFKPANVLSYDRARGLMFAVVYLDGDGPLGTVRGVYTDRPITIDRNYSPCLLSPCSRFPGPGMWPARSSG